MKKYIYPEDSNNFKPELLADKYIASIALAVVALGVLAVVHAFLLPSTSSNTAAVLPAVLVEQTNEARIEEGKRGLLVNPLLEESALRKAEHMVSEGYFAHNAPDGTTPWSFFRNSGYRFTYAGENLAVNFSSSDAITRAWLNSPTHRDNLLSTAYTEIGIAAVEGRYKGRKAIYVVQHFGSPLDFEEREEARILEEELNKNALSAGIGFAERVKNVVLDPFNLYKGLLFIVTTIVLLALVSSARHEQTRRDHRRSLLLGSLLFILIILIAYVINLSALTGGAVA